jgi:hypothetical protein
MFKTTVILLTTVSTKLTDMPDHHVTTIVVSDSYTSFLSVPVSISLPYQYVVHCGWREVTEEPGGVEFFHHDF